MSDGERARSGLRSILMCLVQEGVYGLRAAGLEDRIGLYVEMMGGAGKAVRIRWIDRVGVMAWEKCPRPKSSTLRETAAALELNAIDEALRSLATAERIDSEKIESARAKIRFAAELLRTDPESSPNPEFWQAEFAPVPPRVLESKPALKLLKGGVS